VQGIRHHQSRIQEGVNYSRTQSESPSSPSLIAGLTSGSLVLRHHALCCHNRECVLVMSVPTHSVQLLYKLYFFAPYTSRPLSPLDSPEAEEMIQRRDRLTHHCHLIFIFTRYHFKVLQILHLTKLLTIDRMLTLKCMM
jgi:hypothetical protein